MTIILATNNPGKARELRALFGVYPLNETTFTVLSLADIGLSFTPAETSNSFIGNATQKAQETLAFLKQQSPALLEEKIPAYHDGYAVIADDSGLEIDALNGLPGVDSALYLDENTPYTVRNAHIINKLAHLTNNHPEPDERRSARFVCVVACAFSTDETIITTTATMEGLIAYAPAGSDGFGYDPIFYLPQFKRTNAQLTMDEKNKISHRGKAMREMVGKLNMGGNIYRNCIKRK